MLGGWCVPECGDAATVSKVELMLAVCLLMDSYIKATQTMQHSVVAHLACYVSCMIHVIHVNVGHDCLEVQQTRYGQQDKCCAHAAAETFQK